jgi:hypothetical protein
MNGHTKGMRPERDLEVARAAAAPIAVAYSDYPTCGLWPARGRIAASVLDGDGRLYRIRMTPIDEGECWDCLSALERDFGLDLRLIIPDPGAPLALLARSALARDMSVLIAPGLLVETIGTVAFSRPRPRHYASILARLPDSRFRTHLRMLQPKDPRQLYLF